MCLRMKSHATSRSSRWLMSMISSSAGRSRSFCRSSRGLAIVLSVPKPILRESRSAPNRTRKLQGNPRPSVAFQQIRLPHPRDLSTPVSRIGIQFKRARRELKFLRTRLGRVIRNIRRRIDGSNDFDCQCRSNFPHLCRSKIPQAEMCLDQPAG